MEETIYPSPWASQLFIHFLNCSPHKLFGLQSGQLGQGETIECVSAVGPGGGGGGGVFLGICGREPPGSPNPDPISDQKIVISHTRFQSWPLKSRPIFRPGVGRNYVIIT